MVPCMNSDDMSNGVLLAPLFILKVFDCSLLVIVIHFRRSINQFSSPGITRIIYALLFASLTQKI